MIRRASIERTRRKGRSLEVRRLPVRFEHDERRVIARLFIPGGAARIQNILGRVRQLSEDQVRQTLAGVLANFRGRHRNLEAVLDEHYRMVAEQVHLEDGMSLERRRLIGAYFTMEYSIEAAALFNPSIVEHPNQSKLPPGAVRFLMSFRATGEGHISSVVFRSGVIEADQTVRFDPPSRHTQVGRVRPDKRYDKRLFRRKLLDIGVAAEAVDVVMERLPDSFTLDELEEAIDAGQRDHRELLCREDVADSILWLARCNYQLELPRDVHASEVVLFPQSENERGGIEDLRMVRFTDDDGSVTYYGTYTANNGYRIVPQLMESRDLVRISVHTLNGAMAQNKGMALFPRRIAGHYVMCSRVDGENLYIMYSDMIHFWESAEMLQAPRQPWEVVQVGNCGSPLETPEGWLLLTHGVGPMRRYCIGAMLLDLDDPVRVIGALDEPLIVPTEEEREGYVPNVVYSCGALIHGDYLYIPYGMSDMASGMAIVRLDQLLDRLLP